ncbi:MAG TPA: ABC transporter permease [Desulfobacterales bacterium]|nr:ABC transporter permease [Desulfobacterales bacterium]
MHVSPAAARPASLLRETVGKLSQSATAVAGAAIILAFVIGAIFAPLISPHDPVEQAISDRQQAPFTPGHLLGTDELGRDILSRIIHGARISLVIGLVSVGISLAAGLVIGTLSAYYGGWLDRIVMRLIDIMLAFPYILLTIVIVAILGSSLVNAMIAIGISQIPVYARVVRASVLAEKEADYVMAERSLGAGDLELMARTILPNCLAPIFVQATLGIGDAILSSAALSFLGLGAKPPTPEWGLMIANAKEFITSSWWIVTFPGIAILLTVLGFNLLSDSLRDALDPRLKD